MAIKTVQVCDGCGKPTTITEKRSFIADAVILVTKDSTQLNACSLPCIRKASVELGKGTIIGSYRSIDTFKALWPEMLEEDNTEENTEDA